MSHNPYFLQVRYLPITLFLSLLILCSSCIPYRYPTSCYGPHICDLPLEQRNHRIQSESHWLYHLIPRHYTQIRWYDLPHWCTWAFLGNDDDGIFGEGPSAHYRLHQAPCLDKALAWGWRNPLHNFSFYVIGSAHGVNSEFTLLRLNSECSEACVYRPKATTVFAGKNTSLYIALHGWKPFISSRIVWDQSHESRFYLGWRCRGNFGIRFNPWSRRKSP